MVQHKNLGHGSQLTLKNIVHFLLFFQKYHKRFLTSPSSKKNLYLEYSFFLLCLCYEVEQLVIFLGVVSSLHNYNSLIIFFFQIDPNHLTTFYRTQSLKHPDQALRRRWQRKT